ncbi:MAG: DUF5684 domain-containing protein [Clostridiales bacterium]|nr:DUF5684 domain-containing protein [Clostridiales bacterium]
MTIDHYGMTNVFRLLFGMFSFMRSFVGLVLIVLLVAGLWKMFQKAGEPGWTSIIPFVNTYKLFKIGWGNGWLFLLGIIPVVNFIVYIVLSLKLAKAYGMGVGFGIGLIFLPSIFYIILGFSGARYYGPAR